MRIRMIEDSQGDLVDIQYFCGSCMPLWDTTEWPCIETDYDLYCACCMEHLQHGLQCPTECTYREVIPCLNQ